MQQDALQEKIKMKKMKKFNKKDENKEYERNEEGKEDVRGATIWNCL